MYKEKTTKGLEIIESNSKETHAVEILAALDCQMSKYEAHLKDRLKSVPGAWQQFRMGKAGVANAINACYDTLPVKTLLHMQRLCDHGEVIIRQKGVAKTDDVQFVPTPGLKLLVNIAMENECAICMKDSTGQRKCELRKALMLMAPPDRVNKFGCAYRDVAAKNSLGDYILPPGGFMGSDYFFISELSDITGISYGTLTRKKNIPRSFIAHNVSSKRKGQWIVNKREFFEWYVTAIESGAFAELFGGSRPNHDAIHKAMCDYQASLLENVEARRIALADAMYRKRLKGVCTDERSRRKQR